MTISALQPEQIEAIAAAKQTLAVCDRTHWGRIEVRENDRLRFLHNQSTNDFQSLQPGQGCETVFITSTARTIDLATAYVTDDAVLLIVSPNRCEYLLQWLDKYIFFADRVQLVNLTADTAMFTLIGPDSDAIICRLGGMELIDKPYGTHILTEQQIRIGVGTDLALHGYNLVFPVTQKTQLWETILRAGAAVMDENAWESLRIIQGRPVPDKELTEDYNPLEVGLWQTVSFTKGCYIGQETIARLKTYKGVKTHLWGVKLDASVPVPSDIYLQQEKVGKLTSLTPTLDGYFGLGYIRSKAGGAGLQVSIDNTPGEVVIVPFVSHEYPEGNRG